VEQRSQGDDETDPVRKINSEKETGRAILSELDVESLGQPSREAGTVIKQRLTCDKAFEFDQHVCVCTIVCK